MVTWLRWAWRTLTSMRTALILLLLLAVAAMPGSVLPQKETDAARVQQYLEQHQTAGKILDTLGFFSVYRSPWFASIYLLLFISLIGCVVPRSIEHARALRALPPSAPRNLSRLTGFVSVPYGDVTRALDTAAEALRKRRWRVRIDKSDRWLSAERGYLRETGNLLFHSALLLLVIGVGIGQGTGAEGRVVLPVGSGFSNSLAQYDDFRSGPFFDRTTLKPFSMTLTRFDVSFERKGTQRGAPRKFDAYLTTRDDFGAPEKKTIIRVNHPLAIGGTKVYLTSHGYAPRFTVRAADKSVVWQDYSVFAPEGANLISRGAIKVPDARPQLGFQGVFAPTAIVDPTRGLTSSFPDLDNPKVFMGAFTGDLGLDQGIPQNVFTLDATHLQRLGIAQLRVGDTWQLPNGKGSITFDGVTRWASFVIATDHAELVVLAGALLAILGLLLSLFVPRRRLFLRIIDDEVTGQPQIELAGLVRSGADTLAEDVDMVLESLGVTESSRKAVEA